MVDSGQADLDDWRQRLEENGIAWVRARSISGLEAKHKAAALAVIAEYEEKQAVIRHTEQMKQGAEFHDSQETGNRIQRWILAALIVAPILTIIVTVALATGNKLP